MEEMKRVDKQKKFDCPVMRTKNLTVEVCLLRQTRMTKSNKPEFETCYDCQDFEKYWNADGPVKKESKSPKEKPSRRTEKKINADYSLGRKCDDPNCDEKIKNNNKSGFCRVHFDKYEGGSRMSKRDRIRWLEKTFNDSDHWRKMKPKLLSLKKIIDEMLEQDKE